MSDTIKFEWGMPVDLEGNPIEGSPVSEDMANLFEDINCNIGTSDGNIGTSDGPDPISLQEWGAVWDAMKEAGELK